jgi:4-amino-4-deoxy-L-arabinose transferase-like glycosyltransferase
VNDPNVQRSQGRRTRLVLVLILVLAAVVRVLSFRGYYHSDAGWYTQAAYQMASGQFKIGWHGIFPLRVGLFAPVALAFRVGGVNEVALAAYPFLLSMLGVLVAYLAAEAMLGVRAGLVAASLVAFLPIDVRLASWLLPDMPAALYMNAGVLLLYTGSRQEAVIGKVVSGTLAGLALAASWLCKETVLYLLPFVGLYMLWLVAKDWRNVALLLAGTVIAGFLFGLEGWIYHRHTGDYLFRYHAIYRNYDASSVPIEPHPIPALTLVGVSKYVAHRVLQVLRGVFLNTDFSFTPAAALAACAYAIFRRSRRYLFLGLWFCWLLLVFSFGSASLRAYQPLSLDQERFQYPMLLPAILLVSGLISSLLSRLELDESEKLHRVRRFWGVLISVCLAGVSLVKAVRNISSGMGRQCRAEREMSRILKPTDPLYTDFHTKMRLEFFWKYPATDSTRDFKDMSLSQLPPNVYVLISRDRRECAAKIREGIPTTWQKLRAKDNTTLYWVSTPPPSE